MLVGADLGFYEVKTSTKEHFVSKISEGTGFSVGNEIIINGKKLTIGEGEFQTNYQKSKKENTLPLLFSALAMSHKTEQIYQVVVGLPIQQYKRDKDSLKSLIENNRVSRVTYEGNTREIIIEDVEVAPEGASAYYNLSESIKKDIGKQQLTIVDIGGRTTDVCLFQDKKIRDYTTIGTGMLNIYYDVVNRINEEYSQNLSLEDGEEILTEGLFLYGKKQDISFCTGILKKHFDSIFKDLQMKFNVDRGHVLLTGGGSLVLQKPFKNRLNNLILSENPVFDNALGFKKVGEQLWQQKFL